MFFLVAREFEVGEEVTDKFASLHPERNETVGILNGTDRKWFLHLVGIEVGVVGVGIEGEMGRVGNDALMDVGFRKGDGWGFCFPNFKKITKEEIGRFSLFYGWQQGCPLLGND